MNAFTMMAGQLVRDVLPVRPPTAPRLGPAGNKTTQIRQLLHERGPLQARAISSALGLARTALVGALLKNDLAVGRIERQGDCYAISNSWETSDRQDVADAIRLLRRRGYTVRRPAA